MFYYHNNLIYYELFKGQILLCLIFFVIYQNACRWLGGLVFVDSRCMNGSLA